MYFFNKDFWGITRGKVHTDRLISVMMRVALLYVCVLGLFLTHGISVYAATLYIEPSEHTLSRGDTVTLAVRVNVDEDECINTVDATIEYGDIVRAVDVSRGDSILSIWVEAPIINEDERTITFAGGIPNGYCGRIPGDPRLTNVVAELVFRAPGFSVGRTDENVAEVTFADTTRVLLNDGSGNEARLTTHGTSLTLLDGPGSSITDEWTERVGDDDRPPEPFSIELVQQDGVFSGKYFIAFNTTDKQSGLDHYEVIEESLEESSLFTWGGVNAPWVETESPYVLTDQELGSVIRVKAVDKAGNERIVTLVPDESLQKGTLSPWILLTGALLIIFVGFLLGMYVRTRRKKRIQVGQESDDQENI